MSRARDQALAALRDEIAERQREIAALERAAAIIEREGGPAAYCHAGSADSPCYGPRWSRWCRRCGEVVVRCGQHGGLRAAGASLDAHHDECPEGA